MGIHDEEFIWESCGETSPWKKGSFSAGHTLSFIAPNCEDMESDKKEDFTPKKDENVQKWRPVEDMEGVIDQTVSPRADSGIFVLHFRKSSSFKFLFDCNSS